MPARLPLDRLAVPVRMVSTPPRVPALSRRRSAPLLPAHPAPIDLESLERDLPTAARRA